MKKTSKIFYSLIVVTLMVFNFLFVFKNQESVNLDFFSITNALGESSVPPTGSTCKEGDCYVTIGVPPYAITYAGHYKVCVNAESGTCVNCDTSCDATIH